MTPANPLAPPMDGIPYKQMEISQSCIGDGRYLEYDLDVDNVDTRLQMNV
jgi:hypothetical protein